MTERIKYLRIGCASRTQFDLLNYGWSFFSLIYLFYAIDIRLYTNSTR
jgi:hypothetical protein